MTPVKPVDEAEVVEPAIEELTMVLLAPATGDCPLVLLMLGVFGDTALTII